MDEFMKLRRCETCGGELVEGGGFWRCRFCGNIFYTKQEKGESLILSLNRAAEYRRRSDFDGAIVEYTALLERYPNDDEANWGMFIARCGIEYVKDDRTGKMIPTCHRTLRGDVLEDKYYKKAVSNAQDEQAEIYRSQAETIAKLQKNIKKQMQAEEEYEVFISFKSKDEKGYPTKDSVVARNIHDKLSAQGIKTFFSDVTLSKRVGDEYEPIIYKALHSCKYFILVTTSEEHTNSVWIKNEWSRFRDRMHDEELTHCAFAVFDGKDSIPSFMRGMQGFDLSKYPNGGYEIAVADFLALKLNKSAERSETSRMSTVRDPSPSKSDDKKKKSFPILIVAIALVLLAAIGAGVFVALNRDGPNGESVSGDEDQIINTDPYETPPKGTDPEEQSGGTVEEIFEYSISFNANGGEGTMSAQIIKSNEPSALRNCTFTREGYDFLGWSSETSGDADHQNCEIYEASENVTLYAVWSPHAYLITYNGAGGTVTGAQTEYTVEDSDFTLATPTREGYTFLGWTGTELSEPTVNVTVKSGSSGNRSYIANWQINVYTVTFLDRNGGLIKMQEVEHGGTAAAPDVPLELDGLVFCSWEGLADIITGDTVAKAFYDKPSYTVSYNTSGAQRIEDDRVYIGELPKKPADPVLEGYTFLGWFEDAELTLLYDFDLALDKNTTLYAKMLEGDYMTVSNAEALASIKNDPSGKYILTCDIDLKGEPFAPIESFSGILDGAGYKIYNFVISETVDRAGFVRTNDGVIKNIVFDSFSFTYAGLNTSFAGVVAGYNNGTIQNCVLQGGSIVMGAEIASHSDCAYFGGIAGMNKGMIIACDNYTDMTLKTKIRNVFAGGISGENAKQLSECRVDNKITITSETSEGALYCHVGGIVGEGITGSEITLCTSQCVLDMDFMSTYGVEYANFGGIMGGFPSESVTIKDCVATGSIDISNVSGILTTYAGGAVAILGNNSKLSNVYADVDINIIGQQNMNGGYVGGFVGHIFPGAAVSKSVSVGDVNIGGNSINVSSFGPFAGYCEGSTHLSYYASESTLTIGGAVASPTCTNGSAESSELFFSEDFLKNTLFFDSEIWDIKQGESPKLKCY